jgi:hypothetical protein
MVQLTWFQLRARQLPWLLAYYSELLLEITWEPLQQLHDIHSMSRA